ncbi:mRNA-degrading endonuclease RelE of RelBE toxin-antitoxin system [Flavobacterium araucananum]|uniref:Plasmid stabilization protein n=1 Tax=Flavobacterium araucananum TaxID=946678 RepID=A0A227PI87_9FLAO|nr:type II toxin-antitoxin system RelE/ParE family toxin [Flavobacterium araucananum]OXG08816.1 plasmid stabilization protein [Flavobacterium araucananum]PWJ97687.1 mRNA-degrading endonuclease RelE of RelBE toxin-antitoxin system [Flavobacterium araucananum]
MKVEYLKQFSKDLLKINDQSLKDSLFEVITNLKNAENLSNLSNVKKMKGHSEVYRIRVEKYRLGFFFDEEVIELARFAKREDIYKLFP